MARTVKVQQPRRRTSTRKSNARVKMTPAQQQRMTQLQEQFAKTVRSTDGQSLILLEPSSSPIVDSHSLVMADSSGDHQPQQPLSTIPPPHEDHKNSSGSELKIEHRFVYYYGIDPVSRFTGVCSTCGSIKMQVYMWDPNHKNAPLHSVPLGYQYGGPHWYIHIYTHTMEIHFYYVSTTVLNYWIELQ
jgi:hypothetical protein